MPQRSILPDPFRFAAETGSLTGVIPLADLSRLADVLVDDSGEVRYSLSGSLSIDRKPRLTLAVSGCLHVRCQRCLGAMEWPLQIDTVFELVRPGQPISEDELEEEEFDALEAPPDMDVLALVEDEIMLSVPIAPRHESCETPRSEGGAVKETPFASLGKLRRTGSAQ